MPGVNVITTALGDIATPLPDESGTFFVAGLAERGPVDRAIVVRGLADFEAIYGARASYSHLYDSVRCYFEEGGSQAYIARVVGAGASTGTVTLMDRATEPVATLTITAGSAGSWSENIDVVVEEGASPGTVLVSVQINGEVVEQYNNNATINDILDRFKGSPNVNVANAGSVTVAPDNLPALGKYTLTAGSDDRMSVTTETYVKALEMFTPGLGDGAVAIPGLGDSVHAGLVAHAESHNRIALLSSEMDVSVAELKAQAGAINSEFAGLFAPWLPISDNGGGTRVVPPEGMVAGRRSIAHEQEGAHRAPAGQMGISRSASGVYTEYTANQANDLDNAKVSVIRLINGNVRLYGWRSLSNDIANFGYLHHRDVLNRIVVQSEVALEEYVFAPIDAQGATLARVGSSLTAIMEKMRIEGAFYARIENGEEVDPGYVVISDSSINTTASVAQNKIRAKVLVRIVPLGAMIELTISKVALTSAF